MIPDTRADRVVCRRFLGLEQDKKGANQYMAWATFGRGRKISNRSAGALVTAEVKWFADTYQSWGNRSGSGADWDDALVMCESIGVGS